MNEDPYLSDAGIGESKLRQDICPNGKLAQAEESDAELRNVNHADGELPDGDNALGGHRHPVGSVLEGDVDQGPTQKRAFRFILESPAVPLRPGRVRRAAAGTVERLIAYLMPAFSACLHIHSWFYLIKYPETRQPPCSSNMGVTVSTADVLFAKEVSN